MQTVTQLRWRPLYKHEDHAKVSDTGIVETIDRTVLDRNGKSRKLRGIRLTPGRGKSTVVLHLGCKTLSFPKLMAETWIRPVLAGERVVHIDGDRHNCSLDNLKIVPSHEARRYSHDKRRASNGRRVAIQRIGEIWRPIPGFDVYFISNFARVKSLAMLPASILTKFVTERGVSVVWLHDRGKTTARSIAALMREVWPELVQEYARKRTGPQPKTTNSNVAVAKSPRRNRPHVTETSDVA